MKFSQKIARSVPYIINDAICLVAPLAWCHLTFKPFFHTVYWPAENLLRVLSAISVTRNSSTVAYSTLIFPSCISFHFAEYCKHLSHSRHENVDPLSITQITSEGCFTSVIDFVIDNLCGPI